MEKDDDLLFFQREMSGVKPLNSAQNIPIVAAPRIQEGPGLAYRRLAAQRSLVKDENFLPSGYIEPVDPQAVLSFKRNGIQRGVFQSLMQGRYEVEATLDLHLMTIENARTEVFEFIRDCLRLDVRTALINHGKGARQKQQAIIKSCVARWLPMFPEVMAFHSAQRWHGGAGALYVLLRKSPRQKERTRESLGLKSEKPT